MSEYRRYLTTANNNKRYIKFEDPNAEALCLKYFDSDNDGKITADELQRVSTLPAEWREDALCPSIVKFHEFRYFTGLVDSTGQWNPFGKFLSLEEIILPLTLKALKLRDFCYIY